MKTVYLHYKENRSGGEPIPGDDWCRRPGYIEVSFNALTKTPGTGSFFTEHTSLEVTDKVYDCEDYVYLVIVRYSDGNTFGTTYGHWDVYLVTTDQKEAADMGESIRNNTLPKGARKPWDGYFSSLEDVEIHAFKLKGESPGGRITYHG